MGRADKNMTLVKGGKTEREGTFIWQGGRKRVRLAHIRPGRRRGCSFRYFRLRRGPCTEQLVNTEKVNTAGGPGSGPKGHVIAVEKANVPRHGKKKLG